MNSIHRNHPGQSGMMDLANLIWFQRIHREIVTLTQNCQPCIKIGKNLKPIIPKSKTTNLPPLYEPNEEIQLDFAGPISDEHQKDSYILASVDRYSRYPHAKVYHNCDTETAIEYIEKYIKFHGIPRNIRCDQAQAFKSRQFEIFCNNHNIKLILAPAGDHRANGMIERLIQTIKRRLSVLNTDPKWSKIKLADKIAEIIQEIKIIPNTTTRIPPFTAHFGRKHNTPLSNITTQTSSRNLSYNNIKNFYLDKKRGLKQPMLKPDTIWNLESDSEPELDIQILQPNNEDDSSDQSTLQNVKRKAIKRKNISPIKIIPDKLMVTFGDKTTTITNTRKQIARKTLARRAPEPRGTLRPLWNKIPDGTITNYSPTTLTLDTDTRKNTVIRKNDLAIVNETRPGLMQFVACKTVREYNRKQEKIKQFLLTEKKQAKQTRQKHQMDKSQCSNTVYDPNDNCQTGTSYQQENPGPSKAKPQERKRKQNPTKRTLKANTDFEKKSKEAALAQSRLNKAKERQRKLSQSSQSPRIHLDCTELQNNKSVEVINLISDSSQGSPIKVYTSNDPSAFMTTPASKTMRTPEQANKKLDKIIQRIIHSPKKQTHEQEQQPISITPADNNKTDLISIIPAHQSTPVEPQVRITATTSQDSPKSNTENNNQLVTIKSHIPPAKNENQPNPDKNTPSGTYQLVEQQTEDLNKNTITDKQDNQKDMPEERNDNDDPVEIIHMEEDNFDSATISSISSLNTEDIAALDKLFD